MAESLIYQYLAGDSSALSKLWDIAEVTPEALTSEDLLEIKEYSNEYGEIAELEDFLEGIGQGGFL